MRLPARSGPKSSRCQPKVLAGQQGADGMEVIASGGFSQLSGLPGSVESRFQEGDIARLELRLSRFVPFKDAVASSVDAGLRRTAIHLVQPVHINAGGDMVIRWRKNLGVLAAIALILGLLTVLMISTWVLFREGGPVPKAARDLLLFGGILVAGAWVLNRGRRRG